MRNNKDWAHRYYMYYIYMNNIYDWASRNDHFQVKVDRVKVKVQVITLMTFRLILGFLSLLCVIMCDYVIMCSFSDSLM